MRVFTKRDDRVFVVYVTPIYHGMASISIWERVRPSWIIFRDKYIDSRDFWLADYNYNIEKGINAALSDVLFKENVANKIKKSWEDFEKSIDK